MIVLVTGDREGYDHDFIRSTLQPYAEVGNILIVGGARGVDEQARRIWHYDFQLPYIVVPAAWNRSFKAAGQIRNSVMLNGLSIAPNGGYSRDQLRPGVVLAFHRNLDSSRGTRHCVETAKKLGIEVFLNGQPV